MRSCRQSFPNRQSLNITFKHYLETRGIARLEELKKSNFPYQKQENPINFDGLNAHTVHSDNCMYISMVADRKKIQHRMTSQKSKYVNAP